MCLDRMRFFSIFFIFERKCDMMNIFQSTVLPWGHDAVSSKEDFRARHVRNVLEDEQNEENRWWCDGYAAQTMLVHIRHHTSRYENFIIIIYWFIDLFTQWYIYLVINCSQFFYKEISYHMIYMIEHHFFLVLQ